MKKTLYFTLFFFCFLFAFYLHAQANARETSSNILLRVTEVLKRAFRACLAAGGSIIEDIRPVWTDFSLSKIKQWGERCFIFFKEQLYYRKSIFREEWRKERQELWQSFKEIMRWINGNGTGEEVNN